MKLNLTNRAKKYIKWILILYLLFDLRPILLIPNAILFLTSRNIRCIDEDKCYRVRVFPKLNVGGDSVMAIFSEKNISNNTIKSDEMFGRKHDRSGAFSNFQLSGKTGLNTDIETLYLLIHGGMGGGLGGGPVELAPNSKVEKIISINNYIRISKAGLYRVNFNYWPMGNNPNEQYNLKNFLILQFPENYVSKTLQSTIFVYASLVPNENIKEWCIQHLGYQDSLLSTYFLIKYLPYYSKNAKFWAHEGIIRNNSILLVSRLMKIFLKREIHIFDELNNNYLWGHTVQLVSGNILTNDSIREDVARKRLNSLIDNFYINLDDSQKINWKNTWTKTRKSITDEHYVQVFKNIDEKIVNATTQKEKDNWTEHKKWVTQEYNDKEKRYRKIRLIDFMLAKIENI